MTRSLHEYAWPVLFGGTAASVIGYYASVASGSPQALFWTCVAMIGFVVTIIGCVFAGPYRRLLSLSAVDRLFSAGALVATCGTAGMVSSVVVTTGSPQLQALVLMLALAVIGAANGTSAGRPLLVAIQSLLLTFITAISLAMAWDGAIGLAGALGIYAYGLTSVALALRSHGVQAALLLAREDLSQERTRLAATVAHMPLALAVLDSERKVVTMNHSATALLGLADGDPMHQRSFHDVLFAAPRLSLSTSDKGEFQRRIEQLTQGGQPVDVVLRLDDHRIIDVQGQPMPDGGWVVTLRDTTGERAAVAELSREARRCPLTGLANRRAFVEVLEQRFADGETGPFALILIDLDGFKQVNERLGHPIGDRVITRVGFRLRTAAPEHFLARIGGDEFAMIVASDDADRLMALAAQLIAAVDTPAHFGEAVAQVGLAAGIAIRGRHGDTADALMRAADLALLCAKRRHGSNALMFDRAQAEAAAAVAACETAVETALRSGSLEFHYQPIVNTPRRSILAYELWPLCRADSGMIGADTVLQIAARRGRGDVLHALMLPAALPMIAAQPAHIALWYRVLGSDLRDQGFADRLLAALSAHGTPPSRIILAANEADLMTQEPGQADVIARLRHCGIRLAVDNLGDTVSHLSRLSRLPIDIIALGPALVSGLAHDEGMVAVVSGAASVGRALGLQVVAKGVTDAGTLAVLKDVGVGCVSGDFLSPPVSAGHAGAAAALALATLARDAPAPILN